MGARVLDGFPAMTKELEEPRIDNDFGHFLAELLYLAFAAVPCRTQT